MSAQKAAKAVNTAVERLDAAEAVAAQAAEAEAQCQPCKAGVDVAPRDEPLVHRAQSLAELQARVCTGTVVALAIASWNPQSFSLDTNRLTSLGQVHIPEDEVQLAEYSVVCAF